MRQRAHAVRRFQLADGVGLAAPGLPYLPFSPTMGHPD